MSTNSMTSPISSNFTRFCGFTAVLVFCIADSGMCDEVSSLDPEANVALGVDVPVFSLVFCPKPVCDLCAKVDTSSCLVNDGNTHCGGTNFNESLTSCIHLLLHRGRIGI